MTEDYNPFQSPEVPRHHGGSDGTWAMMPFQSAHQRASIAIVLLAVAALVCTARAVAAGMECASLKQLPDGGFASLEPLPRSRKDRRCLPSQRLSCGWARSWRFPCGRIELR